MARGPNEKAVKAYELYKSGMKLVEIAGKLDIPAGTVRRWKSTYHWDSDQKSERSDKKKANVRKENKEQKQVSKDAVEDVMQNTGLTDKQRLFCQFYIKYRNKTKAYQKAFGCSYECACSHASALWKKVEIQNEIERLQEEYREDVGLDIKDLIQWHLDIARADITDYVEFGNKDINVINPNSGQEEQIKVSYVNIRNSDEVDGTLVSEVSKGRDGVKVKLADRLKAMEWLDKHIGLATEEQRMRIAQMKAQTEQIQNTSTGKADSEVDDWIAGVMGEDDLDEEDAEDSA